MWIGLAIVVLGIVRLAWPHAKPRRFRRYDVLFPLRSSRTGGWHIQLGSWTSDSSSPNSPDSDSEPSSPAHNQGHHIQLPFSVRSSSPTPSEASYSDAHPNRQTSSLHGVYQRLRDGIVQLTKPGTDPVRTPMRSQERRHSRGVLFYLPAMFTVQPHDVEGGARNTPPPPSGTSYPPDKQRYARDFERAGLSHLIGVSDDETSSRGSSAIGHSRDSTSSDRHRLIESDPRARTPSRSRSSSRS